MGGRGGQCPGAPELKGPPKWRQKMKNRKEKKKRENETFQLARRGPYLIYPREFK